LDVEWTCAGEDEHRGLEVAELGDVVFEEVHCAVCEAGE
jgi:hypothetical protein